VSDHIEKTIEQAKEELLKQEQAVITTKRLINQLCSFAGNPPMYQEAELQTSTANAVTVRRNAFFGKPLATAVREFLEMRKDKPVKEASLNEIIDALKDGGFDLAKVSKNEDDMRRGVAITLAKNPQFFRLPNSDWGLIAWYPNVKRAKAEKKDDGAGDQKEPQTPSIPAEGTAPKKRGRPAKINQPEGPKNEEKAPK
jgi:hypothetical protein